MIDDGLRARLLAAVEAARSADELEAARIAALGKSGELTARLKALGRMTPEERLAAAPPLHGLKLELAQAIEARRQAFEAEALAERLKTERLDLSLPPPPRPMGRIHPVSHTLDELIEIFAGLGFALAEGPEIEDDWHNFTALNIGADHPARDMHDTFYLEGSGQDGSGVDEGGARARLLRTHTSPVQIRAMLAGPPPHRLIAPGRVYRADSDATHTPMFHQIEALVIDREIHLGHLRHTIETFLKAFFVREDLKIRLRPSYFPFTEPSVEVDIGCSRQGGGIDLGGSGDWLEVLGAGMVHPAVLEHCGLDPQEWQGFALGCGVDRLAMLKHGLPDLRAFFEADPRWSAAYGFPPLDPPSLARGFGP